MLSAVVEVNDCGDVIVIEYYYLKFEVKVHYGIQAVSDQILVVFAGQRSTVVRQIVIDKLLPLVDLACVETIDVSPVLCFKCISKAIAAVVRQVYRATW